MSSQEFKFPPPPPPPPPKTSQYQSSGPQWQSGPNRGGRGGFPRGRGARGGTYGNGENFNRGDNLGTSLRGQKRRHEQAFERRPKGQQDFDSRAPPPIPSFGFEMPQPGPVTKVQPASTHLSKKVSLGLTPSFDDRDDPGGEDEEALLAAKAAGGAIQLTFRGQTASLSTPEELAAWVAERRKKFYTKAKAAEAAAKARHEAEERAERKAKAAEERKAAMEDRSSRDRGRGRGRDRGRGRGRARDHIEDRGEKGGISKTSTDADNLQRELAEARKRVAELEAKAVSTPGDVKRKEPGDDGGAMRPLLQPSPDEVINANMDDGDDATSSSGGDSDPVSGTDDGDPDDEGPEETSSKRQEPEKVELQPRERKEPAVCREFARLGNCRRGRKCHFKHEPAERTKGKKSNRPGTVAGKSLYQKLVEQQQEASDELVLQHILYLGDNGYLEDPTPAPKD